jgi:hypothetical protein
VAARFTTVDPVRDGNNWFAYVNNDPVNWVDLWGLKTNEPKYNVGVTSFNYTQISYGLVEGLGLGATFNVSGYVNITPNDDKTYTANVTASANSVGANNTGKVTYVGSIEINMNNKTVYTAPLKKPDTPYFSSADSTLIGSTSFSLPPDENDVDFNVELHVQYDIFLPEGAHYYSPEMARKLPIFKE